MPEPHGPTATQSPGRFAMLIVCPSCASQYELDPASIGPGGRKLRCAACRHSWRVEAPEPIAVELVPAEPAQQFEVDISATETDEAPKPVTGAELRERLAQIRAELAESLTPPPEPVAPPVAEPPPEPPAAEAGPESTPDIAAEPEESATAEDAPAPAAEAVAEPAAEAATTSEDVTAPEAASVEAPPAAETQEAGEPVTIESRDHAVAPARPRKPARGKKKQTAPKVRAPRKPLARRWFVAASAVVAALLAGGAIAGRNTIVSGVPQLAVLYEKAGLPVNLVGLAFADVRSTMTEGLGVQPVLVVEGRIENRTRREVSVPEIDVAVRGESGELLYNWTVAAAAKKLEGGQETSFKARLASPPPAGQKVQVTFKAKGRDVKVALN